MTTRIDCILIALLAAVAVPALAQDKVGVVNPAKVFNEMNETKDIQAKLEQERKNLQVEEQRRRSELTRLKQERDVLKVDSPQYREKSQQLLQQAIAFEAWGKIAQADLARTQKTQMFNIFSKIEKAVQTLAQRKGLDLVVAEQRPDLNPETLENLTVDQLRAILNQRDVLYRTDRVDITQDVINLLNQEYGPGGAGATPPAPAP